ncbi:unnamed protein product (macronuclear) [Paramecium tetraurelia]|uniref:Transmembrane protein n=1 Tax=Paramecium tetraurelia TaxID=5888 RepID=A0DP52_PARTE|nr:uncharacterized protein GSPATT00019000001 [Paramecium tetraurelia]CAK84819.1 unnamed protein product [Paramecium tetraurelia]|eukprot:XP_001452216.1 hypothetical protein (macronuclear) [Paramecium tetraurelia strain d4-2]
MEDQEVNEIAKSQVINMLNSQTKSQIFKSQDRDDSAIDNAEFDIVEVNENQCYDANIINPESKIDLQKNKIQDLQSKKEQLEQELRQQQQEVNQLEEQLKKKQEIQNVFAMKPQPDQENLQKQEWAQKQLEYQEILSQYEEVVTQENDKELKDIYQEYYNQSTKARNDQQRLQNSIELEKQLNLEFDQVNQEIDQIKNILDNEINQDNINELQQLLISDDESMIKNMDQQLRNKKQLIEVIQEDIVNLQNQLNEAENKFQNIFMIYNEQRKQIKLLMENINQIEKPNEIGIQKVDSRRSQTTGRSSKISNCIEYFFSGLIALFGGFLMFLFLQDIYVSSQQQQYFN